MGGILSLDSLKEAAKKMMKKRKSRVGGYYGYDGEEYGEDDGGHDGGDYGGGFEFGGGEDFGGGDGGGCGGGD